MRGEGRENEEEEARASEFCRVKSQDNERCSLHATPLSTRTTPSTSAAATPLTPLYLPFLCPSPPPATSATLASFAAISCCDVVHFSRHTFCCLRCCNPRLVGVAVAGNGVQQQQQQGHQEASLLN